MNPHVNGSRFAMTEGVMGGAAFGRALAQCQQIALSTVTEDALLDGVCRLVECELGYGRAWVAPAGSAPAAKVSIPLGAGVGDLALFVEPGATPSASAGELALIANTLALGIAARRSEAARAAAELARAESERNYRLLFDNMTVGFALHEMLYDAEGHPVDYRYLAANPAFERLTGIAASSLIGKRVRELLPNIEQHWIDTYAQVAATGNPMAFENAARDLGKTYDAWAFSPCRGQFAVVFSDVTARKLAEAAVREEKTVSDAIINSLPSIVVMCDDRGSIMRCNDEFQRAFGVAEKLAAVADIVVAEEQRPFREAFARVLAGRDEALTTRLATTQGMRRFDVQMRKRVLGERAFIILAGTDVTERLAIEEALRRSNHRIAMHFQQTPLAVVEFGLDGHVRHWNPAAEKVFGFREAEAIGRHWTFIVPPALRGNLQGVWEQVSCGPSNTRSVNDNCRKDGQIIVCEWLNTPLFDAEGRRVGVASFVQDITGRRRAEELHARLAAAVEQAAESIIITDTDGRIVYTNPAFAATTGYTAAEVLGQNPRLLKSGRHDAEFYRTMWEALITGRAWHGRLVNRRKDGTECEVQATISPVRDAAQTIINYVAVSHDVTREVQLEAQLRQAQKMEAVGRLAGGIAHDFNNILASTMMILGLLQEKRQFDDEARTLLDELMGGTKRAAGLTRQLLMFSRRSVLEPRLLNLNEVVAALIKMLRRLVEENINLEFVACPMLAPVEADAGMLEQVILNLTVNARDAMPRGGTIRLSTDTVHVDAAQAQSHPARRVGDYVCLTVSDTGCGMDQAVLKQIFEPFFTTKERGKGTGLGLATVHGIVAQHRGWVEVDSEVGQGSAFHVYLPASTSPAVRLLDSVDGSIPKGSERILVVEDDTPVRTVLVHTLQLLGYNVLDAVDGPEALNIWDAYGDQIDVLLTDMMMPGGMTGLELAGRVRARNANAKVIISSGYTGEVVEQNRFADAGICYLPKPFEARDVARVVRQCLDSRVGNS